VVVFASLVPLSAMDHVEGFDGYNSVECERVLQRCFVFAVVIVYSGAATLMSQSNRPMGVVEW
jgi:hypothetical protein